MMIAKSIALLGIAACTFGVAGVALAATQPPTFSVTELTNIVPGFTPYILDNRGDLAGTVGSQNAFQAALYRDGTLQLLGTLGGATSRATDINDAGQVTGWSLTASGEKHAFLYSGGAMLDLGTLGGASSVGNGINASGQVAGTSILPSGASRAFLYSGGTMTNLGTLPGGTYSTGSAINNLGQVAGTADYTGGSPYFPPYVTNPRVVGGFFYDAGAMRNLNIYFSNWDLVKNPTVDNGYLDIYGMNGRGDVVGLQWDFIYARAIGGVFGGAAYAISDAGWIVGADFTDAPASSDTAVLEIAGRVFNLNQAVGAAGTGLWFADALDINDSGQILVYGGPGCESGCGRPSGHVYLLTPVPEPGTWALMALGLLAVAGRRARNHGRGLRRAHR